MRGLTVCVVASCSSSSSTSPVKVDVTGAAAKGPLLTGSPITVHMIDGAAHPTGTNFNTTTSDDLGRFDLVVTSAGEAELQADGFYFNELTGALSASQITLFAVAPIASGSQQQIFVNSYTHMSEARAKMLMASGMPLPAAIDQAETELRTGLGLFVPGTIAAGTSLDLLGGDTDANAYLLALSCTLAQAAQIAGGGDANLQQLINNIALDLEDNGMLDDAAQRMKLAEARRYMDASACVANLQARLMQSGPTAMLPDIGRALDFDGDGISDFADPDADGDGTPASADNIVAATTSTSCNFAVDSGGTVWAWSWSSAMDNVNDCIPASLGDWSIGYAHHDALPIPGVTAAQIAIGSYSSRDGSATVYAVAPDGTVVSWSQNAAPAPLTGATGVRTTRGAIASVTSDYAVKTDGTVLQLGTTSATPVSGLSGVLAIASQQSQSTVIQNTDGSVSVWFVFPTNSTVPVTGVSGVTTAGAVSATQNFGFAISNGDVYSFPMTGTTIAATKVNGLPPNGIVSLSGGFAVDQSGQAWDISTPSAPHQFLAGVSQIASPGFPLLYVATDGSLWLAGHSQPEQIRIPR